MSTWTVLQRSTFVPNFSLLYDKVIFVRCSPLLWSDDSSFHSHRHTVESQADKKSVGVGSLLQSAGHEGAGAQQFPSPVDQQTRTGQLMWRTLRLCSRYLSECWYSLYISVSMWTEQSKHVATAGCVCCTWGRAGRCLLSSCWISRYHNYVRAVPVSFSLSRSHHHAVYKSQVSRGPWPYYW